jgi:hypothetical protein
MRTNLTDSQRDELRSIHDELGKLHDRAFALTTAIHDSGQPAEYVLDAQEAITAASMATLMALHKTDKVLY